MCAPIKSLSKYASQTKRPAGLTATVRGAPGRAIVRQLVPLTTALSVTALGKRLERPLVVAMSVGGVGVGIGPGLADPIAELAAEAAEQQERRDLTRVLPLRLPRLAVARLKALLHAEIPNTKTIRVTNLGGATR